MNSVVLKEGVEFCRLFIKESVNFVSGPEDTVVRVVRERLKHTKGDVLTVRWVLYTSPGFGDVRNDALKNYLF